MSINEENPQETTPEVETEEVEEAPEEEPSQPNTEDAERLKALEKQLEEERRHRKEAELRIAQNKFKAKEEVAETPSEDDEDRPLTRKDLIRVQQEAKREAYADRIKELAEARSSSPEEAELLVAMHANRSFPLDSTLKEQIEEVFAIASHKKLLAQNQELARALSGKERASDNPAGTHRDPQPGSAPKQSAADKAAYQRAGFVYDTKSRVYVKELASGKKLIKDPKTKQTVLR